MDIEQIVQRSTQIVACSNSGGPGIEMQTNELLYQHILAVEQLYYAVQNLKDEIHEMRMDANL